ncbi:X-ray repair cross-complementing protein 5 isoform X2 [Hydra vulgaris]|uniref:ATP-dependent DNA helicase II subunit 2 n=1 Tax=Hydra vulgaris TaxID=6087 RepID=A0ABM4BBU7_HYDVU
MAFPAEALAIIIDVSPHMTIPDSENQSLLQKSILAANKIVQRKIFADTKKNKDEATLILFGTNGTFNPLNDGHNNQYKHITLVQELRVIDLDLLKFINNRILPGTTNADFIDALVVAVDHLRTKCLGRKMTKKIVLFSNMCSEFADDQLEMIISAIKACEINLIFVGPEIDDDDDSEVQSPTPMLNNKPLGSQQVKGIKCIRHILESVDGEGMSISEVLPMVSFFEKRSKKQVTAFRGPIEIGASLKINCYAFVKTSEEKPFSWKKLSAVAESELNCHSMEVDMRRSYHRIDEDQTQVEKDNIAHAYRYGKMLVPMSAENLKAMKLNSEKGCLVLGFTSRNNIDRWMFSQNGCHVFVAQPDDEYAAVAFSALCRALDEKNMVAIVRYVSRSNNDPKIGFLTPNIKSSYESLLFIALPFKEDIRQYQFASFKNVKEPSEEAIAAMDSFIDSMTLIKNDTELFNPKDLVNPYMQRQFQCIQHRALNPDDTTIPEVEEYIASSLRVISEMLANAQDQASIIKENFPLQELKQKEKNVNMFQQGGIKDTEYNANNMEDNESKDFLSSLTKSCLKEVGTADPVNDFLTLIENADNDKFVEVCEQMRKSILKLVLSSFLSQYFVKAIQATKSLREQSIAKRMSKVYNALLYDLKEETCGKLKDEFWQLLIKENLSLISENEAIDSTITEDQVHSFFLNNEVEEKQIIELLNDDVDDLFDMM